MDTDNPKKMSSLVDNEVYSDYETIYYCSFCIYAFYVRQLKTHCAKVNPFGVNPKTKKVIVNLNNTGSNKTKIPPCRIPAFSSSSRWMSPVSTWNDLDALQTNKRGRSLQWFTPKTLCVLDPVTDQRVVTVHSVKLVHSRRFFIKQRPSVYSYVQIKGSSCQKLCCLHRTRQNKRGRQDLFRQSSPGAHPRRNSDQEKAAVRGSTGWGRWSSKKGTRLEGEGPDGGERGVQPLAKPNSTKKLKAD